VDSEGAAEGASEGAAEGASEGAAEGASEGAAEGASEGAAEGASEGAAEGASEEGTTDGADVTMPGLVEILVGATEGDDEASSGVVPASVGQGAAVVAGAVHSPFLDFFPFLPTHFKSSLQGHLPNLTRFPPLLALTSQASPSSPRSSHCLVM